MKQASSRVSDREIIELFFQKNEAAITETDFKYRSYLLSVARSFLDDAEDAEECLNDTYHETWNKIPPARPDNLKAFLAVIMRRNAIDRLKKQTRKRRLPTALTESLCELETVLSDRADQETLMETKELGRILNTFLKRLPERRRYLFISRYYLAKSAREIAKALSCSVSTVTKELQKLRNELKDCLEKEGYFV